MNPGKLKNQRLYYIVGSQLYARDARDIRVVKIRRQSNAAIARNRAILNLNAGRSTLKRDPLEVRTRERIRIQRMTRIISQHSH